MAIKYYPAPDIQIRVERLIRTGKYPHVKVGNVHCFRSRGSTARRTLARIWSFPKIWQLALKEEARYVIEVISEKFDHLPDHKKEEILIHELKHIPKRFTGGLRKHGDHNPPTIKL